MFILYSSENGLGYVCAPEVLFADGKDNPKALSSTAISQVLDTEPPSTSSVDGHLANDTLPQKHGFAEIMPQNNEGMTELEAKIVEGNKVALIKSSLKVEGSTSITGRVFVSKEERFKQVWIRWSDDEWSHEQDTISEQISTNIFTFRLPIVRGRKVELAVKYILDAQEYWDNNDGKNFMVCTF